MSYSRKMIVRRVRARRRGMGDDSGPITDPSQVDDSIVVGTVTPTRVDCDNIAADSPFRQPGQVCAPAPVIDFGGLWSSIVDGAKRLVGSTDSQPIVTTPNGTIVPGVSTDASSGLSIGKLVLLAALGGAGYWYATRKKR